jgi:hypothetical protein
VAEVVVEAELVAAAAEAAVLDAAAAQICPRGQLPGVQAALTSRVTLSADMIRIDLDALGPA